MAVYCRVCNKLTASRKGRNKPRHLCSKCLHTELKSGYEGKRYGALVIQEYIDGRHVRCLCDCGKETVSRLDYLKTKQRDCGHSIVEEKRKQFAGRGNPRWKGECDKLFCGPKRWNSWKRGAKTRNLDWKLTQEYLNDIWLKQNEICFYSGFIMDLTSNSPMTVSLDRIDNTKGYVPGNVVFCGKILNRIKVDLPVNEFFAFCKAVTMNLSAGQPMSNLKLVPKALEPAA